MRCKICNKESGHIFDATILDKYNIQYYHCTVCGFMQTEEPYWLEEAYIEPINVSDTGYLQRNIELSKKLTVLLALFFDKNASYVDHAGGYGIFVRLMRDIGFDFYWDDKYTDNLFAKGFEFDHRSVDAVTTFESFEHLVDPIQEIVRLLSISQTIIFSTELLPDPIPAPEQWWYYGLDHGQHISFYSAKTLQFLAQRYDLSYVDLGSMHMLTNRKMPSHVRNVLGLSKFGLHRLLQRRLKKKTWEDHLKMSVKR